MRLAAPFPLGVEGTTAWLRAAADAFGVKDEIFVTVTQPTGRVRPGRLGRTAKNLPDEVSSFSRIPSSKFRWRGFCRANCRCNWSRSVRRISIASISLKNSGCCHRDVPLTEGQDVDLQLDRCRAARPDLVVCGLGLANPLEAEGMTTKWSIELVFTPIQGYEQAADLAELFARPLVRRAKLVP